MKIELIFALILVVTFGMTVIGLKFLIPFLLSQKIGQKILDIGPRWHKNKEGTPTMGGISFIIASFISLCIFLLIASKYIETRVLLLILNVFVYALLNAMVGIIDDFAKFRKKKNEGLKPFSKFAFQGIAAIFFLVSLKFTIGIDTFLFIPFINISIDLGFFYYIFAFLALCGVVNGVNLTDGIDGLASSITLTVGIFFAVIAIMITQDVSLTFFSAVLIGATLGFLMYNFYPAKIFMGDTGSLFLGALVVSVSFIINNVLLVLIYGFVFVVEALSVILQVLVFKITKGKRLFKMAPLHHHLEKCGMSEIKIVLLLTLVNIGTCVLAFWGLGNL